MKRRTWKATALLAGVSCLLTVGVLPLRAGTTAGQENEEDGVTVPQGHKEAYEAAKEQMKEAPKEEHKSGAWYMAGFMGIAWPQSDSGQMVNNATGLASPLGINGNQSFIGGLQGGYYWHDPDKWGNLSFSADAIGAYLGANMNLATPAGISGSALNLGLLGLGGTIGYRIAKSFEPYVGFYGGGVIGNGAINGVNMGNVWGYWFSPAVGLRYFIPNSHWFVAMQGLFLFVNDVNGFDRIAGTTINTTSGSGYLYVPAAVMSVGYAF
ncbi:hypothetical protein MAMC_01889 [Methylacidimicrobium cyclopophantes]|uniref:Outer membrane protein beta-barrel domain-containing protein n=1 Tax=Methylacidimicrobium cyclopophantes TaxID=1041766 RepID=A0A5E6MFB4_9BACT|nr:hypothetical protein [Methylacidimicrobium cyclopophantes]VVM07930.1 hypothetical protein MAMC_01889 [Methylacidimicrobium cyclopophantes]